jgi:hypothetical protein
MATRKRRRRRNPSHKLDDATQILTIAAIGVGAYLVYQIYLQVSSGAASLAQCLANPVACLMGQTPPPNGSSGSSPLDILGQAATIGTPATAIGSEIGSAVNSALQ